MCPEPSGDETERDPTVRELSLLFFEACKFVNDQEEENKIQPTMEEYKGKIQKWDEQTSTSPGTNMHLRHHLKAFWVHMH
jgi:hypothetical protein